MFTALGGSLKIYTYTYTFTYTYHQVTVVSPASTHFSLRLVALVASMIKQFKPNFFYHLITHVYMNVHLSA
jgi:hypothetical protein